MADTLVKGYPQSNGDKIESIVDHTGPASYTVVTPGTPPTGGDTITAAAMGMKSIEMIEISGDNTGALDVVANDVGAVDALPRSTWILRWLNVVGRTEVAGATNLSSNHIRIRAIGI